MCDQNNAIYKSFWNQKVNNTQELSRQFSDHWLCSFRAISCHDREEELRVRTRRARLSPSPPPNSLTQANHAGTGHYGAVRLAPPAHVGMHSQSVSGAALLSLSCLSPCRRCALHVLTASQLLLNKQNCFFNSARSSQ